MGKLKQKANKLLNMLQMILQFVATIKQRTMKINGYKKKKDMLNRLINIHSYNMQLEQCD